ncbi:hypothetical protein Cgig2_017391 [Carnegiea gigantea]|uniref:Uncharacterized protein n=1 Tax=Carnegiea gigantea TaxID=171969 RepID=A0A9Q1JLN6_9CARY|nr:hypothetical protein Cgig2_017391 [Carnegiea gigantea]
MLEFILAQKDGGESFGRNFIIYLVNCFLSGSKNRYYSMSFLKYVKHVNQITSLDWCQFILDKLISSARHYKKSKAAKGVHFDGPIFLLIKMQPNEDNGGPSLSPTLAIGKLNSNAPTSAATSLADASVGANTEDYCEHELKDNNVPLFSLGFRLSQLDSQSPVPANRSVHDPNVAGEKDIDDEDDYDDVNSNLSIMKLPENKSKAGKKPASKKGVAQKTTIMI